MTKPLTIKERALLIMGEIYEHGLFLTRIEWHLKEAVKDSRRRQK